jgi:peptidoglycan/xylan/chitin deacetylase (PgdA/CDA1 family)
MIGVIADAADHGVVREFFELFKTPWEFFRQDQSYDVLLCAGDCPFVGTAKLVVIYAGGKTGFDASQSAQISNEYRADRFLINQKGDRFPIYGRSLTVSNRAGILLRDEATQECAAYSARSGDHTRVRIGYDLFQEIRTLLTSGQPVVNATIPTLELHIDFLRDLITGCGIFLVEIPPVPAGYQFIACLTHDVDHPSIRLYQWDHTVFGFMYRATFGSMRRFLAGQVPLQDLLKNCLAVLKLPFVYLGIAKDFWREFADRYKELEKEFCSTFFIIPFKNRPGIATNGPAPSFRASGYGAQDIADIIRQLKSDGHEVGLHGIDGWVDSSKGSEEIKEIQRLTGTAEIGVRMHWLYYDKDSPAKFEKAGAAYDSTCGYNEAVGYRAGATQVYKQLETEQLLELPLHVMDTALFYPSRMELSPAQAAPLLDLIQNNAVRFGGVLTVNWHDRSLAPERLWDEPYRKLLAGLKSRDAWFATASQTVAWFRMRRSATFELGTTRQGAASVKLSTSGAPDLPQLSLRTYQQAAPVEENTNASLGIL